MSSKIKTGRPAGRPAKFSDENGILPQLNETSIPEPPAFEEKGEKLWNTIWKNGGHLDKEADYYTVEQVCYMADELEFMRLCISTGVVKRTSKTKNGYDIVHPYVSQIRELRVQIAAQMSGLGFGPNERQRLGIGSKENAINLFANVTNEMLRIQNQINAMPDGGN